MGWDVDLAGRTALVTGGSRNIGLEVARAFRSAGARVCIIGRSDRAALDAALEELGAPDDAMGVLVDVGDEPAVVELFDRVAAELDVPTVLVNGAATRPHAPVTELTREAWDGVVETILTGAFLTSRELFRRLPDDERGAIVNLGGLTAHRPARDRAHVIAAKSGLVGLTRALAEEGRGRIRVNAVVPGRIATTRRPGQTNPNAGDAEALGTCVDVARAVLAFSDPRDVYVTGQTVHVSGGRFMP